MVKKHKCPFAKIIDYSVHLAKCKFGGYCPDSVYMELYDICPQYQRHDPIGVSDNNDHTPICSCLRFGLLTNIGDEF